MIAVTVESTDNSDAINLYKKLYSLFRGEELFNKDISNVCSVNIDDSNYRLMNIMFDYKGDLVIKVSIDRDLDIIIEAPDNIVKDIEDIIVSKYPEYIDNFIEVGGYSVDV